MMLFTTAIVPTVTILMMVFTSSFSEVKLPKIKSPTRSMFSSKQLKRSLRQRSLTTEDSSLTKMEGYFEAIDYTNDDYAQSKTSVALDICSLSADAEHEGSYVQAAVYTFQDFDFYRIKIQFFNDSACTNLISTDVLSLPSLNWDEIEVDHVIPEPTNPTESNLDFSLLLYDSEKNCVNNDYKVGVTEAIYGKLGDCIQAEDPFDGDVDTMVVSCSSSQLIVNAYSSTNGSCSGIVDTDILDVSDFCLSGEDTLLENYYGYLTFACAAAATNETLK